MEMVFKKSSMIKSKSEKPELKRNRPVVVPFGSAFCRPIPLKCNDAESQLKSHTNPVIDENQVHWLSDGNCLNMGEIARLLRYEASYPVLVTNAKL